MDSSKSITNAHTTRPDLTNSNHQSSNRISFRTRKQSGLHTAYQSPLIIDFIQEETIDERIPGFLRESSSQNKINSEETKETLNKSRQLWNFTVREFKKMSNLENPSCESIKDDKKGFFTTKSSGQKDF